MTKYRHKPGVINAEQFWSGTEQIPAGVQVGLEVEGTYFVQTLEGPLRVSDGDWIITGVAGEKYPCKPDIFHQLYEPA